MDKIAAKIREQVLENMDLSREMSDEEIEELISKAVSQEAKQYPMALRERIRLERLVFNSLRKLDILQELVDDKRITEIMVNGPDHIFYEKDGCIYRYPGAFSSEEKMQDVIQQIVGRHNRVVNQASPIVDTRLADGSRVNIVLSPISIDGSSISIRKFPEKPFDMEKLIQIGSISQEAADFLKVLVRAKYSIFISGGTGSGKTTFLNALSQYIPEDERIITIEDSAELQLLDAKNLVRLETRNANLEGVQAITIRDLIKTALRMRPDRVIVGECRGEETIDMLQAMNTGHDGSLSTGHANSCEDILSRLEMMVMMGKELPLAVVRQQIASGIDIIVQIGRLRDKSRKVLEIVELDGICNGRDGGKIRINTLYKFEENKNPLKEKGESNKLKQEITNNKRNRHPSNVYLVDKNGAIEQKAPVGKLLEEGGKELQPYHRALTVREGNTYLPVGERGRNDTAQRDEFRNKKEKANRIPEHRKEVVCGSLVRVGSLIHREKLYAAGMGEELENGL